MSVLLQNVTNSIWHAFSSLQNGEFKVNKSKLKVLTANLGTLLDLYGVEKGLDHYRSTNELNFEHFTYYLQNEVFASLPDVMPLPELREYEAKISEVCWLICRKKYLKRDKAVFTDESVFQLFRIFCVLSDLVLDDDKPECYQVLIHASEACSLSEQLVRAVGQSWDAAEWDALCGAAPLAWGSLLALLERKYCHHAAVDPPALAEAVEEMYEVYVEDVVMKGYLMKRGYLLGALREYWCVARPCSLAYYRSAGAAAAGRAPAGRVPLDAHCRVQRAPAAPDNARFHLVTGERTFEFAAQDHKSRLQWMAALRRAVAASGGDGRRGGERARDAARARLQEERRARIAAETQAQELAVMAEEGGRKVLELQNAQLALEKLLEEETQAKKDEEIVRALQARVLAEEWEKREELEKLQEQQLKMLEEERSKRRHYEHMQVEKEIQYREAAERLKQLELERQALDEELRLAQNKIRVAELHAETIGTRLQDMNHNTRHGDRMRKAFSFVPTSKSSSDTHLQLRASSMRRNAELNNNGFVEKRL